MSGVWQRISLHVFKSCSDIHFARYFIIMASKTDRLEIWNGITKTFFKKTADLVKQLKYYAFYKYVVINFSISFKMSIRLRGIHLGMVGHTLMTITAILF